MNRRVIAASIVELNNGALAHFIDGEYDKAIALLRVAYETFELHKMKPKLSSSSSSLCHAQDILECETTKTTTTTTTTTTSSASSSSSCATREQGAEEMALLTMMDCEEALDEIKERSSSVGSMMNNKNKNKRNKNNNVHDNNNDHNASSSSSKNNHHCPYSDLLDAAALSSSPASTAAYSMYNRALVLSEEDKDDYSMFVLNPSRTCAVILYNLALVHHNIGIHLGISSALPHALKLYEMSYQTIFDTTTTTTTTMNHHHHPQVLWSDVQKLLLALWNNMGNIYAHLFHFENTQRCLDHLRLVLAMSSPSSSSSSNRNATIMDEDYIFFFLNALFQGKELCFAPAA